MLWYYIIKQQAGKQKKHIEKSIQKNFQNVKKITKKH